MGLKVISTFLIALLVGGVAAGQNTSWVRRKISGTVPCDKPKDEHALNAWSTTRAARPMQPPPMTRVVVWPREETRFAAHPPHAARLTRGTRSVMAV